MSMWRHPLYRSAATGWSYTDSRVSMQAVMRVGALSGVEQKSCLGGNDAKVRKRDQIKSPHIRALDGLNLFGSLSPVRRAFRTPCWLSKPMGYPLINTTLQSDRS